MQKDNSFPVIPDGSDADRADQSISVIPGAGDAGPAGEIDRDGSEADILEQKAEVPVDDDGYPQGAGED